MTEVLLSDSQASNLEGVLEVLALYVLEHVLGLLDFKGLDRITIEQEEL